MLSPNRKVGGFFCAKGHIKDRFVCYDNHSNFKNTERFGMAYKILLVEDNPQIRMGINDFFVGKSAGELEIIHAEDGDEGLGKIYENEYDLILLDIMLPGIDGYTICKEIRKKSTVPIIFITAKIHEEDMLHGYDMGCDDYITKPFSLKELYAKVQALLKRSKGLIGCNVLCCGDITLNSTTCCVKVRNEDILLPPKEYEILKYLMERKGQVAKRDVLLSQIWGYDYEGSDRVVDNHIKKLRQALGDNGKYLKTVVSKGYIITEGK